MSTYIFDVPNAIELEAAQAQLALWLAADAALAQGAQDYEVNGRRFTRVSAAQIRENIVFWAKRVNKLQNGNAGPRLRTAEIL